MASAVEVGLTLAILALTAGIATKLVQLPGGPQTTPVLAAVLVIVAVFLFPTYPAVSISALLLAAVVVFHRNVRNTMEMVYQPTQAKEAIERRMVDPNEQTNWASVPPTKDNGMYPLPSSPPVVGGVPSTNPPALQNRGTYGEWTIMREPHEQPADAPSQGNGFMSDPRPLDEFNETNPSNPLLGPIKVTEGFEDSPNPKLPPSKNTAVASDRSLSQLEGRPDIGAPQPYGVDPNTPMGAYPINAPRFETTGETNDFNYRPGPTMGMNEFQRYGPDLNKGKNEVFKYYN